MILPQYGLRKKRVIWFLFYNVRSMRSVENVQRTFCRSQQGKRSLSWPAQHGPNSFWQAAASSNKQTVVITFITNIGRLSLLITDKQVHVLLKLILKCTILYTLLCSVICQKIKSEFDTVATSVYVKFTCVKFLQVKNKILPYIYRYYVTK